LSSRRLPALLVRGERESDLSSHVLGFPCLPQGTKTHHILTNRDGLLLGIRHRSRAFFRGQTLPVSARDALGRWFSCFPAAHLFPILQQAKPAQSRDRAGTIAISVHP
jgi:hypothetical protein